MFTGHTDLEVGLARDYLRFLKIEFELVTQPVWHRGADNEIRDTRNEKRETRNELGGLLEAKEEEIYSTEDNSQYVYFDTLLQFLSLISHSFPVQETE